ncbi:hypothetical protein [Psychromicrobium sp. YIM B11713]|uniref:hypothetical protein n=1 Tax=Psychromicrobium sp. YIM B11713 TaxID=3145233 RepID=UPI00374F0D51
MTQSQATAAPRAEASSSRRTPRAPYMKRTAAPSARATAELSSATHGSAARVLNPLSSPKASTESTPARTPLSLVAALPGRRRAPFVVFCFLALVAAMATVLVLNISVSSGQYELVQLNSKKDTLVKQNQVLTQQLQDAQAPQNLAQKAQQLGMVAANSTGQINLDNQTISGSPKPATKLANPLPLIAAPETGNSQPVSNNIPVATSLPSGPLAPGQLIGGIPFAGQHSDTPASPSATPGPQADLHGGSIPSPDQKSPSGN